MAKFGLIGKNIEFSFSKTFFTIKFEKAKKSHTYHNFDIPSIKEFPKLIEKHKDLKGLNVTTPYKEAIIPYLDSIDKEAKLIGAVNTIRIKKGKLKGFNTDDYGFAQSLDDLLPIKEKTALILGYGGAGKAVSFVLKNLSFKYQIVSRNASDTAIGYEDLTRDIMKKHYLIVNCTPVGTFPNISDYPPIPYKYLTKNHVLYDLIYNPRETEFLKRGFAQGARVKNGMKMLEFQAKKSWKIWKS